MSALFNPWFWFSVFCPKPYPDDKDNKSLWEMEFTETYVTRIRSDRFDKEEAKEHCYDLFNTHKSQRSRIGFNTKIKRL